MMRTVLTFTLLALVLSHVKGQCINTETECTCNRMPRSNCIRPQEDGNCFVGQCLEGYQCDCSGFDLCDKRLGTHYTTNTSISSLELGQTDLPCDSTTVINPHAEPLVCLVEGEGCDQACLWSVSVDGTPLSCIRAVPIEEESVQDWYGWTDETKATKVTQALRQDTINVRIANVTSTNDFYYCSIYNKPLADEVPYDGLGLTRTVEAVITARYPIEFAIRDDVPNSNANSDVYETSEDGLTLTARHKMRNNLSDGFCIGPLKFNMGSITVQYRVNDKINGLSFQAWDGSEIIEEETRDLPDIAEGTTQLVGSVSFRPNCYEECLEALDF